MGQFDTAWLRMTPVLLLLLLLVLGVVAGCGSSNRINTNVTPSSTAATVQAPTPTLPADPCAYDPYPYGCPDYAPPTPTTLSPYFCQNNLSYECSQEYGQPVQICTTTTTDQNGESTGVNMCYWTRKSSG